MRLPLSSSPLQVWAVEDTTVQLTWGDLPPGEVTAWAGDSHATRDHEGGPGSIELGGLAPSTRHRIDLAWDGGRSQIVATTMPKLPGEPLCKIATVSDLHLGSRHWGASQMMIDRGPYAATPFPFRCAKAAIDEAQAWGAELLVVKGDAAHHQDRDHFAAVADLLDSVPDLPALLIPGNHDVDRRTSFPVPAKIGQRGIPYVRQTSCVDLPGLRVIVADSTVPGSGVGSLERVSDDVVELAALTDRPFFLGLHHHLQPRRVPTSYPIGVGWPASHHFLDELARSNPRGLVSSGHTHRNRARRHGSLCVTEVGSTRDWPGVWAGYTVHEGGIRQVVRRAAAREAITWHEYSRRALSGLWEYWAPGPLNQRSLVHEWVVVD